MGVGGKAHPPRAARGGGQGGGGGGTQIPHYYQGDLTIRQSRRENQPTAHNLWETLDNATRCEIHSSHTLLCGPSPIPAKE